MIHLDLEPREARVLHSTLRAALSDLSFEIASTDRKDYRDTLKERRTMLEKVAESLAESPEAV